MERAWEKLPHTFTPALKKRVLKDWNSCFSKFKLNKNGFDYILGTLLVSISLNTQSGRENYRPIFSIHNLSRAEDELCANLEIESPKCITLRWHDKNYPEAAERMKQHMPLPWEPPITLDQVIDAYHTYISQGKSYGGPTLHNELADPPLLASWAGEEKKAQECLAWSVAYLKKKPLQDHPEEGLKAWEATLQDLISDPEKLRATARSEVIKHKLTKIPSCCFEGSPYQEPLTQVPFE